MDFEEAKKKTLEMQRKIRDSAGKPEMTAEERFIDLVEEVGELARSILFEGGKKHSRPGLKADVTDDICDILYDLLILADKFGINLNEEYTKILEQLDKRLERGEFHSYK